MHKVHEVIEPGQTVPVKLAGVVEVPLAAIAGAASTYDALQLVEHACGDLRAEMFAEVVKIRQPKEIPPVDASPR